MFDNLIGQPEIKKQLEFYSTAYQKTSVVPFLLLNGAKGLGKTMGELTHELETIVSSGTKLNIQYFIDEELDEDQQDEIMEYFMQSETDEIRAAEEYFDGDYEEEPLRLMRIKFMSEVGN